MYKDYIGLKRLGDFKSNKTDYLYFFTNFELLIGKERSD